MSTRRSKDCRSLCSFTFADGRQCGTPHLSGHPRVCCFRARKEAQARAAESAAIFPLGSPAVTSPPAIVSSALGHVFTGVAPGSIQPSLELVVTTSST